MNSPCSFKGKSYSPLFTNSRPADHARPRGVPAAQRCACAVLAPLPGPGACRQPPGLYAVSRFQPLLSQAARSAGSAGIPAAGRRRSSSKWWPRGCGHCTRRAAVPGGAPQLPRVPLAGAGGFRLRPKILLVGWCSMGKTTFIRHLTKKGLTGLRCGAQHAIDPFATTAQPRLRRTRRPAIRSREPVVAPSPQAYHLRHGLAHELAHVGPAVRRGSLGPPGVLSGEKQHFGRDYELAEAWSGLPNTATASSCSLMLFKWSSLESSRKS